MRVSYARSEERQLAYNRRFWMKDGTVGWNPGKLNPNTIRPAGSIDPEVGVVYFETPEKQPRLTYVNFAMHSDTTGGQLVLGGLHGRAGPLPGDLPGTGNDDPLRQRDLRSDVAIDALAVNSLGDEERGLANGLMFAGASAGQAIGGAGVLALMDVAGLQGGLVAVAAAIWW